MFLKKYWLILFLAVFAGCIDNLGSRSVSDFDLNKVEFSTNTYPVVILGGGVGGLTSAIYMSQANIKTLVLEGDKPGGALAQSHSVRNWPGEENISGANLVEKIKKHAIESGAEVVSKNAVEVDFSVWPNEIKIEDLQTGKITKLDALSVIIAMGATPNFLNVPGEQEYWGRGVTSCAICDGPLYKDCIVGVVGGGDAAIEEINYLSGLAKKVYVFVRRDQFRATGRVKDEVLSRSNVEVIYNSKVTRINGDGKKLTDVILKDSKTDQEKELKLDGLFLAIGSMPNTKILQNQIDLDSKGYVVLTDDQETSKSGIYSVGDISDPKYKQAISSAGEGCRAALQAQDFLSEIGYDPAKYDQSKVKRVKKEVADKEKPVSTKTEKQEAKPSGEEKEEKSFKIIEIKDKQQFEKEVLQSDVPVVVDFFATWCIPCQTMLPIFKKVSKYFGDTVKFVKVNIQDNREVASDYGITSVPTFMFIKDGTEIDRIVGGRQEEQFRKMIEDVFEIEK